MASITIADTSLSLVKEQLVRPFGFKGYQISELWQAVPAIRSNRYSACCPSTQSVLWSDSDVFASCSPNESNMLMYRVTARALEIIKGKSFTKPNELIYSILPELDEYASYICKMPVRRTFVLNSLVGVDFALWSLYALENGIKAFDGIIPEDVKPAMNCRHDSVVCIPLISYNVKELEIRSLLNNGASLLKVKIGKELEWDKQRIKFIHSIAQSYKTNLTKSGKVCYYLDANGRYTADDLNSFLDFCEKNRILDSIAIVEEPFAESDKTDVSCLPVIVNADESAHSKEDLAERIALGYKSVALKPIAKTLSVSFDMVKAMKDAGGMYLCADLTVNPLLAEWNKQFASRISPLSCMNTGCVEVNGDTNYITWEKQKAMLPQGLKYTEAKNGVFACDSRFFADSSLLFNQNRWFAE